MSGFSLDLPKPEEIKEEVVKELMPTEQEKTVIGKKLFKLVLGAANMKRMVL